MRIGDLAAERRKRDRGQDENDRGEQDLEAGVLAAEAEENEHDQHIADEIVVERREELAPEQRREPPRRHQGPKHDGRRPYGAWPRWDAEIAGRVKRRRAFFAGNADDDGLSIRSLGLER